MFCRHHYRKQDDPASAKALGWFTVSGMLRNFHYNYSFGHSQRKRERDNSSIMAKRMIYLVRHGQYDLSRRDDGELTPAGLQQARLTGEMLSEIPFAGLYCSPVRRAAQTAEIIAEILPEIPTFQDEDLRECIPSIPPRYATFFAERFPDLNDEKIEGCAERLYNAFERYFRPAEGDEDINDLVVCHGNVMRFLVARTLDVNHHAWSNMLVNNCGVSRIMIDIDGTQFLISHNDIGHLPPELRTEN